MLHFEIINNTDQIKLNKQWNPAVKFNSKNRILDVHGNIISANYKGLKYQIVEKYERKFTICERIRRISSGVLLVIVTAGFALYFKSVKKLFTKTKENRYFAQFAFDNSSSLSIEPNPYALIEPFKTKTDSKVNNKIVSPKKHDADYEVSEKELQEGMHISSEIVSKIQSCMQNILQRKEETDLEFYHSQDKHRVFSFDSIPDLIFKMEVNKTGNIEQNCSMKARTEAMINAQTVLRTHKLGLLVIPHIKLFSVVSEGKEYQILAEKKIDINPNSSMQEEFFSNQKNHFESFNETLNSTIRQLAIFISETGFSDVEWRNIPILNGPAENNHRKIALIDLEEIDDGDKSNLAQIGLFGSHNRRGLVGCVNEEQGKIVETVAEEKGIPTSLFAEAHAKRKKEIEDLHLLNQYYNFKKIKSDTQPIQIDVNSLDFSEYPQKMDQIKKVMKMLLDAINEQIFQSSTNESMKYRRTISINAHNSLFKKYHEELINENLTLDDFKIDGQFSNDLYLDATCLGYAVNKLVQIGAIHKVIDRSYKYTLQA